MKKIILLTLLVVALVAPNISKAQYYIPNQSFEKWQTSTQPLNWKVVAGTIYKETSVTYYQFQNGIPLDTINRPCKDSSTCLGLQNGVNGQNLIRGVIKDSFPFTGKPNYFGMNYGYFGISGEQFGVLITMTAWNNTTHKRDTILNTAVAGTPVEPWVTLTNGTLTGYAAGTPDTCHITVVSTVSSQSSASTTIFIDEMFFSDSQPTGIRTDNQMVDMNNVTAYPNPFSGTTDIHYYLPANNNVKLKVYDMSGKEVANLINEDQLMGMHDVSFDAGALKSGLYFYRLEAGSSSKTGKLILSK